MTLTTCSKDSSTDAALQLNRSTVLTSPIGSIEFACIHEAGHVIAARGIGIGIRQVVIYQTSKGFGTYWKGATTLAGVANRGLAIVKLGGSFAEHFIDSQGRFRIPSWYEVVTHRDVISSTDQLTQLDLGVDDVTTAQQKCYNLLVANSTKLQKIYYQLLQRQRYP